MPSEERGASEKHPAFQVASQWAVCLVIVFVLAVALTPVRRRSCERRAEAVCGAGDVSAVTYSGLALGGTCLIVCGQRAGTAE